MTELENARLVRLLCKFGFINERPECVLFPHMLLSTPLTLNLLTIGTTTRRGGQKPATGTSSSSSGTTSSTKSTRSGGRSWT